MDHPVITYWQTLFCYSKKGKLQLTSCPIETTLNVSLVGLVGEAVDGHVVDDLVRLVQQTLPHAPAAILVPLPEAVNQLQERRQV